MISDVTVSFLVFLHVLSRLYGHELSEALGSLCQG